MKRQVIVLIAVFLALSTVQAKGLTKIIQKGIDHKAKQIARKNASVARRNEKKILKQIDENNQAARKEVCDLLKDRIKAKEITLADIKKILRIVNDRLCPTKRQKRYKNEVEELGYKLLRKDLTCYDLEIIREVIQDPDLEVELLHKPKPKTFWQKIWDALGDYGRESMKLRPSINGPLNLAK